MQRVGRRNDWIAGLRGTSDILEGQRSTVICHLAEISYRTRRTLAFDPRTHKFVEDEEANRYLSRQYRAPYLVPERV
ncbi:MAG: hypothetical protein EHM23_35355 [Acidobacteria bacterium]|nr:MAG: hypothetical protein EHM23_35355 [Acidobacteriota bacterium]